MTALELMHESVRGIHLFHWLTVAVPLTTLLVVAGVLRAKVTARLLLLGIAATLATALLSSTAPELNQIRYGAPLPMARIGVDPATGDPRTSLTVLRACFVADLLFWCSTAVILGAVVQSVARRLAWIRRR